MGPDGIHCSGVENEIQLVAPSIPSRLMTSHTARASSSRRRRRRTGTHTLLKLPLLLGVPAVMFWMLRRRGTAWAPGREESGPWRRYGPAVAPDQMGVHPRSLARHRARVAALGGLACRHPDRARAGLSAVRASSSLRRHGCEGAKTTQPFATERSGTITPAGELTSAVPGDRHPRRGARRTERPTTLMLRTAPNTPARPAPRRTRTREWIDLTDLRQHAAGPDDRHLALHSVG